MQSRIHSTGPVINNSAEADDSSAKVYADDRVQMVEALNDLTICGVCYERFQGHQDVENESVAGKSDDVPMDSLSGATSQRNARNTTPVRGDVDPRVSGGSPKRSPGRVRDSPFRQSVRSVS